MAAFRLTSRSVIRVFTANHWHSTPCQSMCGTDFIHLLSSTPVSRLLRSVSTQDGNVENSLPPPRKYIESQDPEEWQFVERLLPRLTVPEPMPKDEYPSGWKPQTEEALKHPYYVPRSKNHMPSVYLRIGHRGIGKRTFVKHIKGDIWALERELKEYLEAQTGKNVVTQVNEMCGHIVFKGDYVLHTLDWVSSKGF